MSSMTSVHPPARAVLLSAVAVVPVIVVVESAELHAVVGCVELVTGVVSKVKAIESIPCITAKVVTVGETVFVSRRANSEHVVVSIPGEKRPRQQRNRKTWVSWQRCFRIHLILQNSSNCWWSCLLCDHVSLLCPYIICLFLCVGVCLYFLLPSQSTSSILRTVGRVEVVVSRWIFSLPSQNSVVSSGER